MTAIEIKGAGYPIKKVFSDDFVFNIPNYQRPYAWTTEQTEQLLIDLIGLILAYFEKNIAHYLQNVNSDVDERYQ